MCDSASGSSLVEEIMIDDESAEKKDLSALNNNESSNVSKHRSKKLSSRNNKSSSRNRSSQRMTRSKKDPRRNRERRKSSAENPSIDGENSGKCNAKHELHSDDPQSSTSNMHPPPKVTRSKFRRLERRKAYSSHSSVAGSAKSEPILITISDDDDDDDAVSCLSGRPNRTARVKGELIRKLTGATSPMKNAKMYDSSSSSDYEHLKRKKRAKIKPVKALSVQAPQKSKFIVSSFSSKARLKVKRHRKPYIATVYKPLSEQRQRNLRKLRRQYNKEKKKERSSSRRSNSSAKKSLNTYSVVRRSLRSTSTDTGLDSSIKSTSIIKTETISPKKRELEAVNAEPIKEIVESKETEKNNEKKKKETNVDVLNNENEARVNESKDLDQKINEKESEERKNESEETKNEEESVETKNEKESVDTKIGKESEEANNKVLEETNIENVSEEIQNDTQIEKEENKIEKLEKKDEETTEYIKVEKENDEKNSEKEIQEKEIEIKVKKILDIAVKDENKEKIEASNGLEPANSNTDVVNKAKIKQKSKVDKKHLEFPRSHERLRKLKKKIKTSDKILRKRGRPRLCDSKPVKEIPTINDMIQIPFLQDSSCFLVAPKLPKCRECRLAVNRANRKMESSYCRFMEYRKLCYSKAGTVLNAGFSVPSEATSEDLNKWLPQLKDPSKDLNCNTSKALLEHCGDQFCDLIDQEKEALSLHIGYDKVITWKRIVQGVREMCDVCSTTLFNIHWVCPICGLAVCIDCYQVRKQGITVSEEDRPKNCDEYKWLLCSMRQSHEPAKLIMAQIIPGNALWNMRDLLHKARKKWNIPSYCKCIPQEIIAPDKCISSGICKQLMCFVSKSFSAEQASMYYCKDTEPNNVENNYDDLDFEVTGSALKWLEGTVISNNLENLKHADDYFNSFEDFASLRGNLLQNLEDEDTTSQSDHELTSFSLDDIIACVTKTQNSDKGSGNSMVKHFTQRYPQATSGRDPLPIRIYTKLESNLAFSNVPHSWFCNGRLLFLHQADHKDNLALFQEQWKRGQPILVKGVDERLDMDLWHPDAFCRDFGENRNDLVDCRTGAILKNLPMKRFWEGFECFGKRLKDDEGEYMLLKLKDWPPGEDFSEMLPRRFQDLMKGLPLPEYTHRNGILNLAGRLPAWFVRPDLGPKMYNAYGSAFYPTKGTTNLHLDVSDAVNVMVYVGIPADGNAQLHIEEALKAIDEGGCDSLMRARVRARGAKPGALWHIYNARDTDKIRELLTKVAIERGEKLEANHDPIHDQSWYLDAGLRKRLYRDYGVEGYAIAQCLGDAVFIPAGAPHQVRNLHSCVKVAEDFVSPENIAHCFKLTQEFRHLSDTHTNHEDKLQIKNIIYHVVRDALAHLLSESSVVQS